VPRPPEPRPDALRPPDPEEPEPVLEEALRREPEPPRLASGEPLLSRIATQVSPRSTVTSTCFRTLTSVSSVEPAALRGQLALLGGRDLARLHVDTLQESERDQRHHH